MSEIGLTSAQCDEMIVTMARQGYRLKDIASAVKMTPAGVHYALARIADGRPGRSPKT
jgi:hypothetical protein